jgi:hypothetical protein
VATAGTLVDLGAYPGLIVDGPGGSVLGELYSAADQDALYAELDEIECSTVVPSYACGTGSYARRSPGRTSTPVRTTVHASSRRATGSIPASLDMGPIKWRQSRLKEPS